MTDAADRDALRREAGGADPLAGSAPVAAQAERNRPDQPARRGSRIARLWRAGAVPVLSILLALLLGVVLMLLSPILTGKSFQLTLPITAYGALVEGAIGKPELWAAGIFNAISNTLAQAAPLILGGLSVGLAFKAGLFNIGVAGQFLVGAFTAAVVGASIAQIPTNFAIPIAHIAGSRAGADYGF